MTDDQLLPVAGRRETLAYLRGAARRRRGRLGAAGVTATLESVLGLAPPVAIGWITQDIVDHRSTTALIAPVVLLAVAAIVGAVAAWASGVLLARCVLPELARLRENVVRTTLDLPLDRVEAGGISDLVSRVSGDVEAVTEAAESPLGTFVGATLTIATTLVGLGSLDWRFAVAGLIAVPVQLHTLRWYLRTSRPIYAQGRVAEGRRTAGLLGAFTALPTVRAFRLSEEQRRSIAAASDEAMTYEYRAIRAATRFYGRLNLAELIGLGAVLLTGFVLVRGGAVDVGAATTAALFFAGLFDPINAALGTFDDIQRAGAGLARLVGIVARPHRGGATTELAAGPDIRVDGVEFGYGDGPDVVHTIDLVLPRGRHVAVVGPSGSGKSTFATLLAGIRHPRTGRITLGDTDLRSIDPTTLARTIALVTQETHVFSGTLAENLRLADAHAYRSRLHDALTRVGADRWVELLPDGIDTVVGAGGHRLSAGQAQHLALARLLLLDPPVVVLDEATAEAGSESSRELDAAAAVALQGRTGLIVAHRLSQAAAADEVLVLVDGQVFEHGPPDDLLRAGGEYATLWKAWNQTAKEGHSETPETLD